MCSEQRKSDMTGVGVAAPLAALDRCVWLCAPKNGGSDMDRYEEISPETRSRSLMKCSLGKGGGENKELWDDGRKETLQVETFSSFLPIFIAFFYFIIVNGEQGRGK